MTDLHKNNEFSTAQMTSIHLFKMSYRLCNRTTIGSNQPLNPNSVPPKYRVTTAKESTKSA